MIKQLILALGKVSLSMQFKSYEEVELTYLMTESMTPAADRHQLCEGTSNYSLGNL